MNANVNQVEYWTRRKNDRQKALETARSHVDLAEPIEERVALLQRLELEVVECESYRAEAQRRADAEVYHVYMAQAKEADEKAKAIEAQIQERVVHIEELLKPIEAFEGIRFRLQADYEEFTPRPVSKIGVLESQLHQLRTFAENRRMAAEQSPHTRRLRQEAQAKSRAIYERNTRRSEPGTKEYADEQHRLQAEDRAEQERLTRLAAEQGVDLDRVVKADA